VTKHLLVGVLWGVVYNRELLSDRVWFFETVHFQRLCYQAVGKHIALVSWHNKNDGESYAICFSSRDGRTRKITESAVQPGDETGPIQLFGWEP